MIACVNNAKNSLAQKGNYSPEVIAFERQNVHVPRATDVDDHNMIVPMSRAVEGDKQMERMMKIQCAARTAAIEAENAQAVKMALAGKPRKDIAQNFKVGDQVFVWRRVIIKELGNQTLTLIGRDQASWSAPRADLQCGSTCTGTS